MNWTKDDKIYYFQTKNMAESGDEKKLEEETNIVPGSSAEKGEEYKESIKVSPVCQHFFQ